jgi:Spy/CpxP family protein refolding chaperone
VPCQARALCTRTCRPPREARNELQLAALNGGDVKGKAAAVTALVGQMTELHATTLQEIAPILTPEQRDAMAKMSARGAYRHRGPRPAQG